jgi:hypothetical protein
MLKQDNRTSGSKELIQPVFRQGDFKITQHTFEQKISAKNFL